MTIQEMKDRKRELGYSNAMIAELSGVPLGTVQKIFGGATTSPRYETIRALERVLKGDVTPSMLHSASTGSSSTRSSSTGSYSASSPSTGASRVGEAAVPYFAKKQGEYTVEDYYNLPEDKRFELIDGVIYDMGAPTTTHQIIQMELGATLRSYIRSKGGRCIAMVSPVDVRLDRDNKTMLQPDVFVICDRSQFTDKRIEGAPDFVIEILSPSSRKKDAFIKAKKYLDAGVREYWLVDPDKHKVIVYVFENDGDTCPTIYGFQDQVPVAIFGGDCVIDFAKIYEEIRAWCPEEE